MFITQSTYAFTWALGLNKQNKPGRNKKKRTKRDQIKHGVCEAAESLKCFVPEVRQVRMQWGIR